MYVPTKFHRIVDTALLTSTLFLRNYEVCIFIFVYILN